VSFVWRKPNESVTLLNGSFQTRSSTLCPNTLLPQQMIGTVARVGNLVRPSLRILLIEDSVDDASLVVCELARGGYDVMCERVDRPAAVVAALDRQAWDIAIASYGMPAFAGAPAIDLLRQGDADLPFIFMSGTIGEDAAVAAMRMGAHDYIMKGNLTRLLPAVERELRDAGVRRERRRVEQRLAHLAYHDALTDLPNRALLHDRLDQAARVANREGTTLALLLLDLNGFKEINDTLGHHAGDRVLQFVAARLRATLREVDTVARLGGDEFSILQTGREQPVAATDLAAQITECLAEPFEVDGQQVTVSMSIGIAVSPGDGTNPDQLIKNATLALHRAKSEGRGNHRFFEPDMDAYMQARSKLQLDLRKALAKGEFELHYQPIVNLERDEISCLEALMRWHHPERGLVSPVEFIPLAEETGLIVPIGEWALREACAAAAKWPDEIKVAINLSASQFKSRNLVETVFSALAASRLPAPRLELEITESVLLQNNDATLATLHQLRALGVRIAMDDFGTGYSSLSYLRSFPFDKIKIDRCFVADLSGASEDALAILRAVAGLGHSLGIATTAEGVETEEQLERVREEGCTEMQGYFFSPPRPIREIERLFLTRAEKTAIAG